MKFIRYASDTVLDIEVRMPEHPPLRYFRLIPEAFEPIWGTDHAACFDLKACLPLDSTVTRYDTRNDKDSIKVLRKMHDVRGYINVEPGERVMVPSGLVFDIPVGYCVRLHPRSGLSLKSGLVLVNQEAVIDSDYVEQTFILVTNVSGVDSYIFHGDRIAQGEMQLDIAYEVLETTDRPQQRTNRNGGLGSTGLK